MNIGIDVRVLERRMTGVGRYLISLLKHLPNVDRVNNYHLFSYNVPYHKNKFYLHVATGCHLSSKLYSPVWLNFVLPPFLKKYDIDLLFLPNYLAPIKRKKTKWQSIILIHDVFHKIDNNYHPYLYQKYVDMLLPISIDQCGAIVTNSAHTKRDIIKFYKFPPEKIFVVHPSADERFKPRVLNRRKRYEFMMRYQLPESFILYVGVIENRKNIIGILHISDILRHKGIEIPIILVGTLGFGSDRIINEIKKRHNVFYLSYIENKFLPYFYNTAKLFLFPSFYEGFGIPPLEAMKSGLPVLASNTSSLPEVIEDAGIMHHPKDYESFAKDIDKLLTDKTLYEEMSKKAIMQAEKFDAKKSAKKLAEVFEKLT